MTAHSDQIARAIKSLLEGVGLPAALADWVEIEGADPVLPSPYRLGEAAAASIGACAAAAALLWEMRGGERQEVRVDVSRAAAALNGWAELRIDGEPLPAPHIGNPLFDSFRCRDGRWLQLQAGLPVLVERTLRVLRCGPDRASIGAAVAAWGACDLEEALARADACGAVVRTEDEWVGTEQGARLRAEPVVALRQMAASAPQPLPFSERPLGGVRVLDLTRVIAGPVHGRTLAEHGASVLLISSPHLPNVLSAMLDTGAGKRSALLDLKLDGQRARLETLLRECDVFAQGYRPGALARLGLGPAAVAALHPSAVYVSVSCYGTVGPWLERRGWEQTAQASVGLAVGQGAVDAPRLLPVAACDYITGYLAALGTIAALIHRTDVGGTYSVDTSLCRTGMWIQELGTCRPATAPAIPGTRPDWTLEAETAYGKLRHMAPVAQLARTPAHWSRPVEPPGTSRADWTTSGDTSAPVAWSSK